MLMKFSGLPMPKKVQKRHFQGFPKLSQNWGQRYFWFLCMKLVGNRLTACKNRISVKIFGPCAQKTVSKFCDIIWWYTPPVIIHEISSVWSWEVAEPILETRPKTAPVAFNISQSAPAPSRFTDSNDFGKTQSWFPKVKHLSPPPPELQLFLMLLEW